MGWLDDTADWFKRTNTAMDVWFYDTVDKVLTGNVTGRSTAQHAEDLRNRPDLQGTSQTGLEHAVSRDSHDRTRDGVKTLERTEVVMRKGTIITANLLLPGSGAAVSAAADSALGHMNYDSGEVRKVGLGEMAVNAFSSATVTGAVIDGGLELAGTFNGAGGSNQPSGQATQPGNRRHGTGATGERERQDQSSGMNYGIIGALIGGGLGLFTGGFTSLTGILVTVGFALGGYALASNLSGDKGGRLASSDVVAPTTPTGNRQSQPSQVPVVEVGAPTSVVAPGHNQNAVLNR